MGSGASYGLTGILSRVAWCIRCLLPLLPQPSAALLSQMATQMLSGPLSQVIRGTMITSLSEAVVLSTDVVAEG